LLKFGERNILYVSVASVPRKEKHPEQRYGKSKKQNTTPIEVIVVAKISGVLVLSGPLILFWHTLID
jgi:hypothetical protein